MRAARKTGLSAKLERRQGAAVVMILWWRLLPIACCLEAELGPLFVGTYLSVWALAGLFGRRCGNEHPQLEARDNVQGTRLQRSRCAVGSVPWTPHRYMGGRTDQGTMQGEGAPPPLC
ncbi:hypothetical protein B0I35DRAFT_418699 [Stachybotrys elegans]|uniref:Uncharacterized protein n=1 Tax=Stachybotrys elegans TaxID=80388 RepID=A0A8K0T3X2_9HYPO|nr:hypothetical protein B0I35DRAFT_418699 [Stachybotrys elegans]